MTAEQPPCPRCYSQLPVLRPWAGFRWLRVVWWLVLSFVVAFAPILASDIVVMIPLSVLFLFGGGPIFAFAKQAPTCVACGLERPHPGWHETPCRPVVGLSPGSGLRVSPSATSDDEPSGVFERAQTKTDV